MDALYQDKPSPVGTVTSASSVSNGVTKFQGTVLIFLVTIGLALMGWYIFEVTANLDQRLTEGITRIDAMNEKINAPVLWEYRIESVPDASFDSRINAMGKDGWELVFARRASDGSDYSPTFSYEMIFKRPKKVESLSSEKPDEKKQPSKKR